MHVMWRVQAYAQKINQCLVQMSQTGESIPSMAALHTWAKELSCLKVALAMGNLKNSVAYSSFRLDGRKSHSQLLLNTISGSSLPTYCPLSHIPLTLPIGKRSASQDTLKLIVASSMS